MNHENDPIAYELTDPPMPYRLSAAAVVALGRGLRCECPVCQLQAFAMRTVRGLIAEACVPPSCAPAALSRDEWEERERKK